MENGIGFAHCKWIIASLIIYTCVKGDKDGTYC
jgi:hypothetical protein